MLKTKKLFAISALALGLAISSQASAHGVVSETMTLPSIDAGDSMELTISCPARHYAVAGGFQNNDQLGVTGPFVVTANYPKTTRTWAIEVTNGSGRPTSSNEARVTLYVTCSHHHGGL